MLPEKDAPFKWVHCPQCGRKTHVKIYEKTAMVKFPLFCPWCKKQTFIDVIQWIVVPSE